MLRIALHGGHCCGIKTIYGFPYGLDVDVAMEPPLFINSKFFDEDDDDDHEWLEPDVLQAIWDYEEEDNFYPYATPKETLRERFKRYLDFLKKERPAHLIEVTLQEEVGYPSCSQIVTNEPMLLEEGFKKVVVFRNSNSGNLVHVYHLVFEGGVVKKGE